MISKPSSPTSVKIPCHLTLLMNCFKFILIFMLSESSEEPPQCLYIQSLVEREVIIQQSKRGHNYRKHYCHLTSALFSISHLLSIFMAKTLSAFFSFTTATWKRETKDKWVKAQQHIVSIFIKSEVQWALSSCLCQWQWKQWNPHFLEK